MTQGASGSLKARGGQYLALYLGGEAFGLEIDKVQEIIGIIPITRVPRMPDFIRGVINLRGKIVPVVDLRLQLGLEAKEQSSRDCIVVTQVQYHDRAVTMGLIVDEVTEVLSISEEEIEPAPDFGTQIDTEFILGMGKLGHQVVTLIDVAKVLSGSEMKAMTRLGEGAEAGASAEAASAQAGG